MEYTYYKNVTDSNSVIWICGKVTQLSHYIVDNLKPILVPHYYANEESLKNFRDNIINLNNSINFIELEELLREPPFIGDTFLILGDLSDIDQKYRRRLFKILGANKPYIKAIIYISNYKDYKTLADNKDFKIGHAIYLFKLPKELYKDYARDYLKCEISDKALNSYIKRTDTYQNFLLYLAKLKTLTPPITSNMLNGVIPNCSVYDLDDYIKVIITRDKKTIHMKALNNCLNMYRRDTHKEIVNAIERLIDIKKLTLQGYLLAFTVDEDITYLSDHELLPESLFKLSTYKIKELIDIASVISLPELHLIYLCFLNVKPTTQNLFILTEILYNRDKVKHLVHGICTKKIRL